MIWLGKWGLRGVKNVLLALASVAQLVGAMSCKLKSCRFNSRPVHMPGFQIWSEVRAHVRGSRSMFLSHMDISLSLSPSLPFSLKSISMSLGEDKKGKKCTPRF